MNKQINIKVIRNNSDKHSHNFSFSFEVAAKCEYVLLDYFVFLKKISRCKCKIFPLNRKKKKKKVENNSYLPGKQIICRPPKN